MIHLFENSAKINSLSVLNFNQRRENHEEIGKFNKIDFNFNNFYCFGTKKMSERFNDCRIKSWKIQIGMELRLPSFAERGQIQDLLRTPQMEGL